MFCSSCGAALSKPMKYCSRCGAQLIVPNEAAELAPSEKRVDEYLEGIFWVPVFGLGLILGGLALMKLVLNLSEGFILAYLILSSTVFLINFALQLWGLFRVLRISKKAKGDPQIGELETNELDPGKASAALEAAPSVTENTTSKLEARAKEKIG
jgi:hypothetical protein